MRFRCVNGICVLQRLESKRQSAGGILLPDTAQKKSETCRVIEACPAWVEDGKERTTVLRSGDYVCISKYSGQEFEIAGDGGEYAIVLAKEKDILCILDDFIAPVQEPRHAATLPEGVAHMWVEGVPAYQDTSL